MSIVEIVQRQTDLFQVVAALSSTSRFAGLLNRGQQQTDQHANNGDDDQQFDQRESASPSAVVLPRPHGSDSLHRNSFRGEQPSGPKTGCEGLTLSDMSTVRATLRTTSK